MMNKKKYLNDQDIRKLLSNIIRECTNKNFIPNAIVAPSRGGLPLGVMLSHYYSCPMYSMTLSHRDTSLVDVLGIERALKDAWSHGDNTLFIDDINDSGRTIETVREIATRLPLACNLKVGVLLEKYSSKRSADFVGEYVNTEENDVWVVFPWENWWR